MERGKESSKQYMYSKRKTFSRCSHFVQFDAVMVVVMVVLVHMASTATVMTNIARKLLRRWRARRFVDKVNVYSVDICHYDITITSITALLYATNIWKKADIFNVLDADDNDKTKPNQTQTYCTEPIQKLEQFSS